MSLKTKKSRFPVHGVRQIQNLSRFAPIAENGPRVAVVYARIAKRNQIMSDKKAELLCPKCGMNLTGSSFPHAEICPAVMYRGTTFHIRRQNRSIF